MNNYIYEMHVALLRIQYVLPDGWVCYSIQTEMRNWMPYDLTRMEMKYSTWTGKPNENEALQEFKSFEAYSLQELAENVRVWSIENRNTHSVVEKSPEDGTDSVINTHNL